MRILYVNKFFHKSGGVESHFFNLAELMEKKGHKVAFFSMHDELNEKSKWQKYFVSRVSYEDKSVLGKLRFIARLIYSFEAKKKIKKLLDDFRPDIVHLHDIHHQISASIITEIVKLNIPIVQNLGSFHLISPNYNLFHNGKICEITKKRYFYKAILHKCVKNSFFASLIEVFEKYFHKLMGWDENLISKFVVPSKFLKNKLIDFGVQRDKIIHIPHFVKKPSNFEPENEDYVLYFGRLSEEKGLFTLLNAMQGLPEIQLKIVGKGKQKKILEDYIKKQNLKNIEFINHKSGIALQRIIANSKFTVLPSQWYEVFGLSIIESFSMRKTVIAAKIGGIPEIVQDKQNGLLFRPGEVNQLQKKIKKLFYNGKLLKKLKLNAFNDFTSSYSEDNYYTKIMKVYSQLLN